ncbi:hypothetical protein ENSA5_44220 [Enhygromyxa salina]|uniref:Uncharacterized protein n=1 Tax=Enhygromyxa salina TaxID=215803 RepID=A0A2S9XJW8_9BACT|nr:hypothetical protein [Enhygromyxa salina]PRP93155.1 hypothetical protein ENSA5_44220 [Enhygromyxa salina]
MQVEQQILDAGAEIVWVLEQDSFLQPGTAEGCRDFLDGAGSTLGWCVGDSETQPMPGTFDNSPFSVGRGFDIIVPRQTMAIAFTTNHGTPGGNENISGEELLAEIIAVIEGLDP